MSASKGHIAVQPTRFHEPRGSSLRMRSVRAGRPGSCALRPGAILLEVLISIALLVFGLSVVGLRVTTALETTHRAQAWTTGVLLSETVASKLQGGDIQFSENDDEVKGHFGIFYPGYSWRIKLRECEIENMYLARLEIGYNANDAEKQKSSPEADIDFDNAGTQTLRTVYRLVPVPADINISRDMGIPQEDLDALLSGSGTGDTGSGTGSGSGGTGNPALDQVLQQAMDFLTQHPDILTSDGGLNLDAIRKLPKDEFQDAMTLIQTLTQFMQGGGNLNSLLGDSGNGEGGPDGGPGDGGPGEGGPGRGRGPRPPGEGRDGGPDGAGPPPDRPGGRNEGGGRDFTNPNRGGGRRDDGGDNAGPGNGGRDFTRNPRRGGNSEDDRSNDRGNNRGDDRGNNRGNNGGGGRTRNNNQR